MIDTIERYQCNKLSKINPSNSDLSQRPRAEILRARPPPLLFRHGSFPKFGQAGDYRPRGNKGEGCSKIFHSTVAVLNDIPACTHVHPPTRPSSFPQLQCEINCGYLPCYVSPISLGWLTERVFGNRCPVEQWIFRTRNEEFPRIYNVDFIVDTRVTARAAFPDKHWIIFENLLSEGISRRIGLKFCRYV